MDARDQLEEYLDRLSRVTDELESITRGLVELSEQTDISFALGHDGGFDDSDELEEDDIRPDKPTM